MLTAARQWGELAEHVPNACANIVRNPRRPVGPLISLRRTICVNLSIMPISSVGRIRYTSSSAPMRDSRGHNMPVRYAFEGRAVRTSSSVYGPTRSCFSRLRRMSACHRLHCPPEYGKKAVL